MDRHFIESYEDEREVLRKIEELKKKGFAEADMYVIARSNEQLTGIRTRTEVEYHTAEGRGMGRLALFFCGGPLPAHFSELADETKVSSYFYQQLIEGRLLLFFNKDSADAEGEGCSFANGQHEQGPETFSATLLEKQWTEEEQVFIDGNHYESFLPLQAEPLQNRHKPNSGKRK